MKRNIKIDRAVYEVDDTTKTYRYLRQNPEWRNLMPAENEANKQSIDGYTRTMRDGRKKRFIRSEHP